MNFSTVNVTAHNNFLMRTRRGVTLGVVAAGLLLISTMAFAASNNFVRIQSTRSFSSTIGALKESINSNHMMVMGSMNQGRVLSMTGL